MADIIRAATLAVGFGISIIPLDSSTKQPVIKWSKYIKEVMPEGDVPFTFDNATGIGVVCGRVSGNIECLDFEYYDVYESWMKLLEDNGQEDIVASTYRQKTPGGGVHVVYRLQNPPGGSKKLARDADSGRGLLIETRGEGGYFQSAPSPGYEAIGGYLSKLPVLSDQDHDTLIEAATHFDSDPEPKEIKRGSQERRSSRLPGHLTPGTDYTDRADVPSLLESHGWKYGGHHTSGGRELWTRPGKESGPSATWHPANRKFVVFSRNASIPASTYTPFALYAALEHNGDLSEAAKVLRTNGWGDPLVRIDPLFGFEQFSTHEKVTEEGREVDVTAHGDGHSVSSPGNGKAKSRRKNVALLFQPGGPRFAPTELGNAERFVEKHGDNVRFANGTDRFLIWSGRHWEEDTRIASAATEMIVDTLGDIQKEAFTYQNEEVKMYMLDWAKASQFKRVIDNSLELAKRVPGIGIKSGDLDRNRYAFNVLNGTIDLRTGELGSHCKDDYITKLIGIDYNPESQCPTWHRFLETSIPDEGVRLFIQRAVGYSLTGDTREQVFFFCYGNTGDNGKTTFMNTIMDMMGDYCIKTIPDVLMAKEGEKQVEGYLEKFNGARMVYAPENQEGRRLNESLIKRLTGEDPITARKLYCDPFTFDPQHKIWFSGNFKPVIRGTDEAIWRRPCLIPFQVKIEKDKRDPELKDKLREELPGILAWAVQGCLGWQRNGLPRVASMFEVLANYRQESDLIGNFLRESTELDPQATCSQKELFKAYKAWMQANNEYCLGQSQFHKAMSERGLKTVGGHYDGLRMIEDFSGFGWVTV